MENTLATCTEVLLVEDNRGDVCLIRETLKEARIALSLNVARDGVEALKLLRREGEFSDHPPIELVVLDLNLPKRDGREVLGEIRNDPKLRHLPVIILTSSSAQKDIRQAYAMHANCYVVKPLELDDFIHAVRSIEDFWLSLVKLPPEEFNT